MERERVDIGGTLLDAAVSGRGNVTVIFENGLSTSLEEWDGVIAPIEARARILRYDRRRTLTAGPVPTHSAELLADDLAKLLAALKLEPPYVLVGHSWGGVVARVFAQRHPDGVVGLVFVDASHEAMDSAALSILPGLYALLGIFSRAGVVRKQMITLFCPPTAPPAYRARVERTMADPARWAITLRTARSEIAGFRESFATLRRDCADLPAIAARVLLARDAPRAKTAQRVHRAWETMVARAANARLEKVAASGHHMPFDAPSAVTKAIADVLDTV